MPTYDYKCLGCGTIITELRNIEDRNNDLYCKSCHYFGRAVMYFIGTPSIKWKCEAPTKPSYGQAKHSWES